MELIKEGRMEISKMIKGNMRGADIKDDKREYERGGYQR